MAPNILNSFPDCKIFIRDIRDQPVIWEKELTRSRTPIDMGQCVLIYHQIVNTNKGLVFSTSGVESLVLIFMGLRIGKFSSGPPVILKVEYTDYFNVGF